MSGKNVLKALGKKSSTIFIGLSIISTGIAVVEAVRGTIKAKKHLEEKKEKIASEAPEEKKDEVVVLEKKEVVKTVWKDYVTTGISLTASIAFAVLSHRKSMKDLVVMTSVASMYENKYHTLDKKTKEILGKEKHDEIKSLIAKDEVALDRFDTTKKEAVISSVCGGNTLFRDGYFGTYFRSDLNAIKQAVLEVNHGALQTHGLITVNDLYYGLGLDEIKIGDVVGWRIMERDLLDFELEACTSPWGEECTVIIWDPPTRI